MHILVSARKGDENVCKCEGRAFDELSLQPKRAGT